MIDPKQRQRSVATETKPRTALTATTNAELLAAFQAQSRGKLADKTLLGYSGSIKDAIRYFARDGSEIPVAMWSREAVWEYLQFVESNYCASFRPAYHDQTQAICYQRVWKGAKPALSMLQATCNACPLFKRPGLTHRLNALGKWFRFLTRAGKIPHNFMPDLANEVRQDARSTFDAQEKRRNPSVDEMAQLVNGTTHPQRRAFYAASAKWWFRPNEMLMLDRYASFGLSPPTALDVPEGFQNGFPREPNLKPWDEGGDMVYLPETKGALDKRKGNRWTVIDNELRPLLAAHFEWWNRTVQRNSDGTPKTTALWLTEKGRPLEPAKMYPKYFIEDAERLGILEPGERHDPRRTWTAHCQRHFGQKILQLNNVPSDWNNHFRGDKMRDARGHYYKPTAQDVRMKYHEFVPRLGFNPLPTPIPLAPSASRTARRRVDGYLQRAGLT